MLDPLTRSSLTLERLRITAAIDRDMPRLAEHMIRDYPERVLTALQATR